MAGTIHDSSSPISRRRFILGASAAGASLALYSGKVAAEEIDVVHRTIAIRRLPDAFHGFRIAQISDIHLDQYTAPGFVERVIAQTNALNPEMVLLTGDFVSRGLLPLSFSQADAYRCGNLLRALTCPLRFACLGNHDTVVGSSIVIDALAKSDIPTLVDRYVPIERGAQRFWLAGLNDPSTENPHLDRGIPARPDGPLLLMVHEPDFIDHILRHRRGQIVDLVLAGHSHGGQVRLPLLGPVILPLLGRKYVEGHFQFGPTQLYVNRGIGTVGLPFRLNCPPEITLLTLQPTSQT